MDEQTTERTDDQRPVSRLDLLYITQAYNRREISFEEWLRLSREWAERVIRQCKNAE